MEMYIQKIGMFRPDKNPRSCNLDLNLDWSVDYTTLDSKSTEYTFKVQNLNKFPLDFKIEGLLKYNKSEEFSEKITPLIFDQAVEIVLKMINLTKEINLTKKTSINFNKSNKALSNLDEAKDFEKLNFREIDLV